MTYNPSDVGVVGSIFGYPYDKEEAEVVILPVPWDVTASYGSGTAGGPQAILDASPQLDLSIHHIVKPWTYPTYFSAFDQELIQLNKETRVKAEQVISDLERGNTVDQSLLESVNDACAKMNDYVKIQSKAIIDQDKIPVVLGGDHSTPLGLMQSIAETKKYGILQIDAHMDLRDSYEGFKYSHASIMHNALQIENVLSLTQVGIRDYCEEEESFAQSSQKPIHTFYDDQIKEGLMVGESWSDWVQNIISFLPKNVYVSFDIDGLMPDLCPNTGTPVPGGISFGQATYLLKKVVASGRKIIGFDLCEVSPGENDWDANVGARMLYRLISLMGVSQGKIKGLI